MQRKSNEVIEESREELEFSNEVQQNKKSKAKVIISIVVGVFIISCCSIVLYCLIILQLKKM